MRVSSILLLATLSVIAVCHEHFEGSGHLEMEHEHSHVNSYEEPFVSKHEHHNEHHHHHHHKNETKGQNFATKTWFYAISAVFGISVLPCLILFFIPVENSNGPLLKILLAFGAGGLLGDAILHIIPHALHGHHDHNEHHHEHSHSHDHGHSHDHSNELRVGTYVIAGVLIFMLVEQFVRIAKGGHCHSHGHDAINLEKTVLNDSAESDAECGSIKVTAYLNLVADFVHNLTDGLAIGASFSAGNSIGMMTTFTVLLHELPHEIGDFAILVQSGFSKWKAIRVQFITALGALTGCIISLIVTDPERLASGTASSWIMPFTAGGFIYIATVSIIPELLEYTSSLKETSKSYQLVQSVVHIIAISLGVAMMYCVSFLE